MRAKTWTAWAFLSVACSPASDAKPDVPAAVDALAEIAFDDQGFELDPPGTWFDGDLHVHATGASNDTGGESPPELIAATARARGLHFLVLTDHSNSTGSDTTTLTEDPALFNQGPEFPFWDKAAALSVPGVFLMVDGNEVSPVAVGEKEPRGHIGCIPMDLKTFDRDGGFTDRPRGVVTGGQALAQAKARGCFTVINHPYALIHMKYDWTAMDYDAIETWNGGGIGFDALDHGGVAAWKCDLLAGRHVVAVGGSDNHRVKKPAPPDGTGLEAPLGWPRTAVFAKALTWPDLIDGLRAGRVMIRTETSAVRLDAYDQGKRRVQAAQASAVRWLRLRGRLDPQAPPATLRLVRATACNDTRPGAAAPTVTETEVYSAAIAPGADFAQALAVTGEPGVYTATLLPDEAGHHGALSPAVVVK